MEWVTVAVPGEREARPSGGNWERATRPAGGRWDGRNPPMTGKRWRLTRAAYALVDVEDKP